MRGWKAISFDQFKSLCMFRQPDEAPNGLDACFDDRTSFGSCSACICVKWRKLGRADIMVEKITVRAKRPVQQAKHKITPKKCKCAYVSDCNYKPGSIECSMNHIPA